MRLRGRRNGRGRPAGFRPRLEVLEGRAVPSTGQLDPTFGSGPNPGVVLTHVGTSAVASAVAVQPDGKIVAAGRFFPVGGAGNDVVVARYNPDGSPDPTFQGGVVVLDFDGGDDYSSGLALLPGGK